MNFKEMFGVRYTLVFTIISWIGIVLGSKKAHLIAPYNVRTTQKFSNGVQIEWAVDNSTGVIDQDKVEYLVRFRGVRPSDQNQERWKSRSSPNALIFLSPLSNGVWYEIQVKSIFKEGSKRSMESPYSTSIMVSLTEPQEPNLSDYTWLELTKPLPTPMGVKARIAGETKLKISWNKAEFISDDLYYLVTIAKRNESDSGIPSTQSQIRIQTNNFLLDRLEPGTMYTIQVQSRLGTRESRQSNPAVVSMPKRNDYFTISDVSVHSYMSGLFSSANLTWQVPPTILSTIQDYLLFYTIDRAAEGWGEVVVGREPRVILDDLNADTQYYVRIVTTLNNGMQFESQLYSFKTPTAEPIRQVDVIFSSNAAAVKLEWTLEDYANRDSLKGYKVIVSPEESLPDSEWKKYILEDAEITLAELLPAKTYFVKISVTQHNKPDWVGRKVYRFTTLAQEGPLFGSYGTLNFLKTGPKSIKVMWKQPYKDDENIIGFLILYSEDDQLPHERWHKIMTHGKNKTNVVLQDLSDETDYFVKIMGRKLDGTYSDVKSGTYVINTGRQSSSGGVQPRDDTARVCLSMCNSEQPCLNSNDHCVQGNCVPNNIYDAIKNE